jgi:hypothetical protein
VCHVPSGFLDGAIPVGPEFCLTVPVEDLGDDRSIQRSALSGEVTDTVVLMNTEAAMFV